MNKKAVYISIILLIALITIGATNSYYFKINKSFETFGAIFRGLSANYVEEIDPEDLVKDGIRGMLGKLDPYTVYLDESHADDMDVIATGKYTGLGITVGVRDGMLTVLGIQDGFSAQRNGLRIGDRLLKIDTALILESGTDELRKHTKGAVGSKVDLWVLRDGLEDTLFFELPREEIKLNNISYSGLINNDIAYIKIDRFTRKTAGDVNKTLSELKSKQKLSGLIIDFRDNPGGLLESAVSICELFVPKNSEIVSTKGRNPKNVRIYRSIMNPVSPNLPLAVIINGRSASASEIVAGALQDLDRGIIVGKRSFGKGLVQSVFEMPYKTALKITTARYYTPSGRCIQKINYSKNNKNNKDTNEFFTKNGRKVSESIGIKPDSIVEVKDYPFFVQELQYKNMFFNFANEYSAKLKSIPLDFSINKEMILDFNEFIERKEFYYETPLNSQIDKLKEIAEMEKLNQGILDKIDMLMEDVEIEEKNLVKLQVDDISDILKIEIMKRFLPNRDIIAKRLEKDEYVQTAINLLKPKIYNSILAVSDSLNSNEY